MSSQANELWIPRCPRCGNGHPMLAPANGFTKFIVEAVEIYCQECQYRAVLSEVIKQIYIRS